MAASPTGVARETSRAAYESSLSLNPASSVADHRVAATWHAAASDAHRDAAAALRRRDPQSEVAKWHDKQASEHARQVSSIAHSATTKLATAQTPTARDHREVRDLHAMASQVNRDVAQHLRGQDLQSESATQHIKHAMEHDRAVVAHEERAKAIGSAAWDESKHSRDEGGKFNRDSDRMQPWSKPYQMVSLGTSSDVRADLVDSGLREWAAGYDPVRDGNPPSWVVDEAAWEKAKEAADKTYARSDPAYWAVVATIYQKMGGGTK